ncbi:MutS-related protein [Ferruginibacter sp. SUN106]|uniref:MutS-related protein n=1 Tax=Ferruginibacter sp. SUN106 TaxID=2978348 RepID=UPI003D359B14
MHSAIVIYLLAGFFIIWGFSFFAYFLAKKRQKKRLQALQQEWGKPNTLGRNYELIENFSLLTTTAYFHQLTAQTITDIDLHDLFAFIDRTTSKPGQQYLFNKLIRPTDKPADLKYYNEQVDFFSANEKSRAEAQLLLSSLGHHDAYYITNLLDNELLEKPKWSVLFVADTIVVILLLLLSIKFPVLLLWLMFPLAVNIFLYFRNKNTTANFNKSFPQLNNLINIARLFIKKDIPFEKVSTQKSIDNLKGFQRKFRLLNFSQPSNDEITQTFLFLLELLKAFFLIETHSFFSCLATVKNKKEDINTLINYIGSIDAAISTAALRSGTVKFTTPQFTNHKKEFSAVNLYHPLIKDCIANSITVTDKSILITGSNMSGKSTFIRTIAINSILAQTIYTCFADAFTTPFVKVFSSVRITDSLQEGKSYYFEEVNTIGSLIKAADRPFQNLFILDEVFKGTNTIERVAAAKAILSYLNKNNNIVFVSTHDIELADLLKTEFDLYHFTEDIANEKLVFDHELKAGVLKTRNAIKLLALSNYPSQIIEEANTIANKN